VRIDTSRARAMAGVRAVITGEDFAAPYGVIPIAQNEWPLARDRVRYRGEPLFAVAADDIDTAEAALRAVEVEIERLPAYFDADAARADDAVRLHDNKPGNLERLVEQEFGDVDAGFAAADLVMERSYDCAEVAHGQIELNSSVAQWDPERAPADDALGDPGALLPAPDAGADPGPGQRGDPRHQALRRRRFRPPRRAAELRDDHRRAGACGRRDGEARAHARGGLPDPPRPPGHQDAAEDRPEQGRPITAVDAAVVQRGGAYAGYGLVTILYAGALLHALYTVGAVRYRGERVYTNLPPCGAMRGHGAVNVRFAFEALLDEMATELGLDPFALRRANLITVPLPHAQRPAGQFLRPAAVPGRGRARQRLAQRRGRLPADGPLRRGLGMACSHYVSGSAKPVHWSGEPHAVIQLRLDFDGAITILTGASDIGQGSNTLLTQIVAEVLLLPMGRIRVIATDSALTPKDNGSYSSRVSFMVGNAALRAAEAMKQALVDAAAKRLGVAPATVEWAGESCRAGDAVLDFAQVVQAALTDSGTLTVKGHWSTPPETQGGRFRGAAVGSTAGFSYAAQVAEVEVDTDTGEVRVLQDLDRPRLRAGDQPAGGRGPGAGRGLDGAGPGPERAERVPRGPAAAPELHRLPHGGPGVRAADRGHAGREHRPAGPVRRQGGQRRRPARHAAGGGRGHPRCARPAPAGPADDARARARGAAASTRAPSARRAPSLRARPRRQPPAGS
jgi:4-hydroxybenzoyl-CoA reductase subunit alpha